MGSLPASFDPYISAVNATSSVMGKQLSADDLMLTITEEYERRNLKSKSGKKDENVALYSNDSEKGKKGGSKKDVVCHNCGKKGHYKNECWAEGGGKEGQGPKQRGKAKGKGKGKETAATSDAQKEEPKDEEAWMAMADDDLFLDETVSDDLGDLDTDFESVEAYYCFIEEEEPVDCASDLDYTLSGDDDTLSGNKELLDNKLDDEAYSSFNAAYLAGTNETRSDEVDLYDSGATRHMSRRR